MNNDKNNEQDDDGTQQSGAAMETGMLSAIHAAEIDRQIATARKFPRSLARFKSEIAAMACLDDRTAEECLYALPRKKKDGTIENIEGPSARFAEIVASAWGNCRAGARIVAEEERFIVAQGIFHDLERNVAIQFEVRRRIAGKYGKYSDDMVSVTGNAAASIALRNAVLKGVPKAYWAPAYEEARTTAKGKAETLASRRTIAFGFFHQLGISAERVCAALGVKGIEDVDLDKLGVLRAWKNSLKDGEVHVDTLFPAAGAATPPPADDEGPRVQEVRLGGDAAPQAEPDDDTKPPPNNAGKKGKGKKGDKDDAPAKGPKLVKPDGAATPAAEAAAAALSGELAKPDKAAPDAKGEFDDAGNSCLPITATTTFWTGAEMGTPTVDGTLSWNGDATRFVMQWQRGGWHKFVDQELGRDETVLHLRRRITQAMMRDKLNRDAANAKVAEILGLAKPPATFNELTFAQLVAVLAKVTG